MNERKKAVKKVRRRKERKKMDSKKFIWMMKQNKNEEKER